MAQRHTNTQMFALERPPPETIEIRGQHYRLVRVFKHDFFAATCLYEATGGPAAFPRVVVKFGRTRGFCGLPSAWLGRLMRAHEQAIYGALEGVAGVPRWVGCIGQAGYAIEYVDGVPLDHLDVPPEGFFERLREVFDEIHARGVGYCDANKRSNILVGPGGRPFLVDYQLSLRRRDDWCRPLRALTRRAIEYVAERDLYHLYKHKRRAFPDDLTPEEDALSRRRGGMHWVHRKLTKPWRTFRRRFLSRQYEQGRLASPTAELEDHYQPEKATWRKDEKTEDAGHGPQPDRPD